LNVARFLNQHSFLLLAAVALAVSTPLATKFLPQWWNVGAIGAMIALLFAGLFMLRTGKSTLSTAYSMEDALRSGKPILLEIYSDY